ncbi:MAG: hypothetical protein AAGB48_05415 [Planctomycetota bacterium]
MSSDTTHTPARHDLLWVTAFALAALIALQLGHRLHGNAELPLPESPVLADMVASVGDYSAMTTAASEDEELLYVLDNRNEQLLVYQIGQQRSLVLLAREDLASVFARAQGLAGGSR